MLLLLMNKLPLVTSLSRNTSIVYFFGATLTTFKNVWQYNKKHALQSIIKQAYKMSSITTAITEYETTFFTQFKWSGFQL